MFEAMLLAFLLLIEQPFVSLSLDAGNYEGTLTVHHGDAVIMGKVAFTITEDSRIERFQLDTDKQQIDLKRLPGGDWLSTTTPKVDISQPNEHNKMKQPPVIFSQVFPSAWFQAVEYKINEFAPNCFICESEQARVIASKSSLVFENSTWQPAALIFWTAGTVAEAEPVVAAYVHGDPVQIRNPSLDIAGLRPDDQKWLDKLCVRTFTGLVQYVAKDIASHDVSYHDENDLRLYSEYMARSAGVDEEFMAKWVAVEKDLLEKLLRWYQNKGPQTEVEDEQLADISQLYPDERSVQERLDQLRTLSPATALFGDTARLLRNLILAAQAIASADELVVTDQEIASLKQDYLKAGFVEPSEADCVLSIRLRKSHAIVERHVCRMIETHEIEFPDVRVRECIQRTHCIVPKSATKPAIGEEPSGK
ncbi:MAG: hypothetical protein IT443_00125 [Phycisphaeraceae bacterium]|nr:hypothetical protein [Phycisphaeraceae bacterium]